MMRAKGFTLIEMVVAITIGAILVGFTAMLISTPVDAYLEQSGRSELHDSSQRISRTLAEDLRSALPNSVRLRTVGTRAILEMLTAEQSVFYASEGSLGVIDRELALAGDSTFSVFGRIDPSAADVYPHPARYLALNNTGTGLNDAYRLQRVITPTPVGIDVIRNPTTLEESVTTSSAIQFMNGDSPTRRLFFVSGPVAYVCNTAANSRSLRRFSNYAITAARPTSEVSPQLVASGVSNSLLGANISSCRFSCSNGADAAPCAGTLVVEITTSRAVNGGNETVRLLQQYPMDDQS